MTAAATFQSMLNILSSGYQLKSFLIYSNNIVIFSRDVTLHIQDVAKTLSVLKSAGVILKLKKCRFFKQNVEYLQHNVERASYALIRKDGISS